MKVKCLVALLILALSTTVALADSKTTAISNQISVVSNLILKNRVDGEFTTNYEFNVDAETGDVEYKSICVSKGRYTDREFKDIDIFKLNLKFVRNIEGWAENVNPLTNNKRYHSLLYCENYGECVEVHSSNNTVSATTWSDYIRRSAELSIAVEGYKQKELSKQLHKLITMIQAR